MCITIFLSCQDEYGQDIDVTQSIFPSMVQRKRWEEDSFDEEEEQIRAQRSVTSPPLLGSLPSSFYRDESSLVPLKLNRRREIKVAAEVHEETVDSFELSHSPHSPREIDLPLQSPVRDAYSPTRPVTSTKGGCTQSQLLSIEPSAQRTGASSGRGTQDVLEVDGKTYELRYNELVFEQGEDADMVVDIASDDDSD